MGAFIQKPKSAHAYQNTYYDGKTSEYGHYEPEVTGKRHGRDGSQANITEMRWVEDNRQFNAPAQQQAPAAAEVAETAAPVELSQRGAASDAGITAYEDVLLNRQGDFAINNDASSVQEFKNQYQDNLVNNLKVQDPSTLASKMAEIELADKNKALMEDSFSLEMGGTSQKQGQQAGSRLQFS